MQYIAKYYGYVQIFYVFTFKFNCVKHNYSYLQMYYFVFQMIEYILCTAFFALLLISYFYTRRDLPPGPFNLPVLGYLLGINPQTPHLTFTNLTKKYGPIYSFYLGRNFTVVISDAKILKQVFSLNSCQARPELYVTHGIMNGWGK